MDDDRRRILIFGLSIVVGLASGSNYVYSAYAPQLSTDLHISSTTVNLIGLAGNLGVYSSGPLWGKMIDSRGQRIPLLLGGLFSLIGYSTIRLYLLHPTLLRSDTSSRLPPLSLRLIPLLIAMFLTGAAGSAGLASSVNATARSFPPTTRASATGAVLAGFGLSAFFFSSLGHVLFGGEASGLLGLLAIGTGIPMLLGAVWVRATPPREDKEGYERLRDVPEIVFDGEAEPDGVHRVKATASFRSPSPSLELIRSRSPHITNTRRPTSVKSSAIQTDYTPLELLRTPSFLLLGLILAILCGTGLMYINNVGTIALVLARGGKVAYDKKGVSGWQAVNVGWISVWNCLGRIGGGVISDVWSSRYQGQRIWLLPIVASLFILSQLSALYTTHVDHLWMVSSLLGGAYGCLFNVLPMLVLEWYGMSHFSQNFGWICVAPVIGGNLFNLVFGTVYDSNSIGRIGARAQNIRLAVRRAIVSDAEDGTHDCLLGVPCYAAAFKVSLLGCFIALGISIGLGLDRQRRIEDLKEKRTSTTPNEEEEEMLYGQR